VALFKVFSNSLKRLAIYGTSGLSALLYGAGGRFGGSRPDFFDRLF
jgi:hypothetical protein